MTEYRPIIDEDREATPAQMAVLMDGVEASLDHVVADTLVPGNGYAGLAATFADTDVTVATGRLYKGGQVYSLDQAYGFDVRTRLPTATKRIVLVLAYTDEVDDNGEQVYFLDLDKSSPGNPVFKPVFASTTHRRIVKVTPAYGDEAPNPVDPDAGLALPIARLVLTPAGISSCVNLAGNAVPVLADVATRTTALETWEAEAKPQISSIASDLSRLSNSLKNSTSQALIGRMLVSIASLNAKVGIPSTAADSAADYLLAGDTSDLANPLSNVKVEEGSRFADDGAADVAIQLFNQYDPNATVRNGVLFPAFDRSHRMAIGPSAGVMPLNSYAYSELEYTQLTMARQRIRTGPSQTVCSNSAFWQSGTYDPVTKIFTRNGETFSVDFAGYSDALHAAVDCANYRLTQFWVDTYSEPYWGYANVPGQINGCHMVESWVVGQDMWIEAVGLFFQALAAQGDVTLLCCVAKDTGAPDLDQVLGTVTIPYAQLVVGENVFAFQPFFVKSGTRLAFDVVGNAAHQMFYADGAVFPQGTFFTLTNAGFAVADLGKHICFNLYTCRFRNPVVSLQLQNLQLAGGIVDIDILTASVVPKSTALTFEVQIAGVWTPLNADNVGALNAGGSMPPNLAFRATMVGTPDVMPAIDTLKSNIHVSRPKTSKTHIWPKTPRLWPVPTSQIRVLERFESFDAAYHAAACKLLTGAGFATETAPASFSDQVTTDGAIERTSVFNLGAPVTASKVKLTATTTTPLKVFHGAWIKDYCL